MILKGISWRIFAICYHETSSFPGSVVCLSILLNKIHVMAPPVRPSLTQHSVWLSRLTILTSTRMYSLGGAHKSKDAGWKRVRESFLMQLWRQGEYLLHATYDWRIVAVHCVKQQTSLLVSHSRHVFQPLF